jgi:hypothetical protein
MLLELWIVLLNFGLGLCVAFVGFAMTRLPRSPSTISRGIFAAAVVAWPAGLVLELDPAFVLGAVFQAYLVLAVWRQVTYKDRRGLTVAERAAARKLRADTALILIEEYGQRIGTYKDKEVPSFIRSASGEIFYFVGIAPTHEAWRPQPGQTVVSPGLLFEAGKLPA